MKMDLPMRAWWPGYRTLLHRDGLVSCANVDGGADSPCWSRCWEEQRSSVALLRTGSSHCREHSCARPDRSELSRATLGAEAAYIDGRHSKIMSSVASRPSGFPSDPFHLSGRQIRGSVEGEGCCWRGWTWASDRSSSF